jgi:hypothetical protein
MKKSIKKHIIAARKVARFITQAFNDGRKDTVNYDFDSRVYWR